MSIMHTIRTINLPFNEFWLGITACLQDLKIVGTYSIKGKKLEKGTFTLDGKDYDTQEFSISHNFVGTISGKYGVYPLAGIPLTFSISVNFTYAEDIGLVKESMPSFELTLVESSLFDVPTVPIEGYESIITAFTNP